MTVVKVAKMLGVPAETQRTQGEYSVVIKKTVVVYDQDQALNFIRTMSKAAA